MTPPDRHALELACNELVAYSLHEHPDAFAARWEMIARGLRDQLADEERMELPPYQRDDPEEAEDLRNEHAQLRALIDEIDMHVRHRGVHVARLRRLATILHDHVAHEDASLYAWAARHRRAIARRRLLQRLRQWRD